MYVVVGPKNHHCSCPLGLPETLTLLLLSSFCWMPRLPHRNYPPDAQIRFDDNSFRIAVRRLRSKQTVSRGFRRNGKCSSPCNQTTCCNDYLHCGPIFRIHSMSWYHMLQTYLEMEGVITIRPMCCYSPSQSLRNHTSSCAEACILVLPHV